MGNGVVRVCFPPEDPNDLALSALARLWFSVLSRVLLNKIKSLSRQCLFFEACTRPKLPSNMRDLSELPDHMNTGFLGPRASGAALAALGLSQAQVDRFACDGFVGTDVPILTHTQLEQLRDELDALVDETNPPPNVELLHELHYNEAAGSGSVLFHCLGHWRISPGFHDILFLDSICVAASQLLQGRSVRFWHDQAFVKPAGHGAVVQVRRPTRRNLPRCRKRCSQAPFVRAVAPGLFLLGPHWADGPSHGLLRFNSRCGHRGMEYARLSNLSR